jgi:hypothetical protein
MLVASFPEGGSEGGLALFEKYWSYASVEIGSANISGAE